MSLKQRRVNNECFKQTFEGKYVWLLGYGDWNHRMYLVLSMCWNEVVCWILQRRVCGLAWIEVHMGAMVMALQNTY